MSVFPSGSSLIWSATKFGRLAEWGWAGKKNGELLELAATWFDVFVTVDRGLKHQQNLAGLRLGVVTLVAHSNEIGALRPLMPRLKHAVRKVKPGQVIRVTG